MKCDWFSQNCSFPQSSWLKLMWVPGTGNKTPFLRDLIISQCKRLCNGLERKTQSCSLAPWDSEVCHVSINPWFSTRTVSSLHEFLSQTHCRSTAAKVCFLASAEIKLYKCVCPKQIWTASVISFLLGFFFFVVVAKWCIFCRGRALSWEEWHCAMLRDAFSPSWSNQQEETQPIIQP